MDGDLSRYPQGPLISAGMNKLQGESNESRASLYEQCGFDQAYTKASMNSDSGLVDTDPGRVSNMTAINSVSSQHHIAIRHDKAKLSYRSVQTTRNKAMLATLVRLEVAKSDMSDLVSQRYLSISGILCERFPLAALIYTSGVARKANYGIMGNCLTIEEIFHDREWLWFGRSKFSIKLRKRPFESGGKNPIYIMDL
ncbi:hypothetical protein EAG_08268 [Camponotus floridanus]|uniref:Uncharacterized protein n=1 Tax=Camponotus floridanus TaxID=104421 RepID=E2AR20_CAMFO|nr:hypothetical protein EAG_08268 [Camponotus floridanus]